MAKKVRAAKPKADRPRKAPKTKSDAPGAGHNGAKPMLSADEERALFLNHRQAWVAWKAKLKAVEQIGKDVKAALKSDGFHVKQFQIADALATDTGEVKIEAEVKDRLQVARWIGHPLGAQMDLFEQPDRTPLSERAYDAGKQASMENRPASPQHAPDTEAYREYMAGFHDHQRELAGGLKARRTGDESTLAHREAEASA